MQTKKLPAKVKALTDEGEGVVEALISTYDVDSVGDKVMPGAFEKTLAEWQESGDNIPVVWSHQHNDPFAHIGEVTEASETDDGLLAKMQFDLKNPTAQQAYRLIKGGRIRNYSFAYEVRNAPAKNDAGENLLTDLKVFEVGPTLIGANQNTRTISAKAEARMKRRTLAALVESNIHRDFTNFADSLYGEGVMTRDERIALSGAIGDALAAFVGRVEADAPQLYERDIWEEPEEEPGEKKTTGVDIHFRGTWSSEEKERLNQEFLRLANEALRGKKASRNVAEKAGRTLSAKNESELRTAHESIGRVLSQLEEQGKNAQPAAPVKAEDSDDEDPQGKSQGKAEEPNQLGPADEALILHHHNLMRSRG